MREVYFLYCLQDKSKKDSELNYKLLGIYSSINAIGRAIAKFRHHPNFKLIADNFLIELHEPNESDWNEGFIIGKNIPSWADGFEPYHESPKEFATRAFSDRPFRPQEYINNKYGEFDSLIKYAKNKTVVYLLLHYYEDEFDNDICKLIGVYSSFELAEQARERYLKLPGFRETPNNLDIGESTINSRSWEDGFFTYYY